MGQRSYTAEYRSNAVALAKEMGASAAAKQLGIPADTLYTWVSRAKKGSLRQSPINAGTQGIAGIGPACQGAGAGNPVTSKRERTNTQGELDIGGCGGFLRG